MASKKAKNSVPPSELFARVLSCIVSASVPVRISTILRRTKLRKHQVERALLAMRMAGRIELRGMGPGAFYAEIEK